MNFPRVDGSHVQAVVEFLDRNALMFFTLWTLFGAAHHLILGPYSFIPLNDEGDLSVPRQLSGLGQMFSVPRPFWSPALVGGADSLASMQDPNIDGLLYLIFPTWLAFGMSVWITAFVTSFFLYKLLRDHLNCPAWISLGCALCITPVYSIYPQPQPLAVLVLALWATPWALTNFRLGIVAFIGLGALVGASSGYAYAIFHLPALAVCLLALWPNLRAAVLVVIVVLGYLLYDGAAIVSAILNAPISNRANQTVAFSWSANYATFLGDLKNWGWVCILGVAAALISNAPSKRLWLLSGASALIVVTPIVAFAVISLIASDAVLGQFIRTHIGMPLIAGVTTGVALPVVVARLNLILRFRVEYALVIIGAISIVAIAVLEKIGGGAGWRPRGTNFTSAYDQPDLQDLRRQTSGAQPFRVATVVGTRRAFRQETMYPVAHGFEMADGYINLFPKRYHQFWADMTSGVRRRLSAQIGSEYNGNQFQALYDLKGGLLEMCKPNTVVKCKLPFSQFYNLDMLSLANTRFLISPVSLDSKDLKLLPSPRRASLIAGERKKRPKKLNALLAGTYNPDHVLYIYENTRALPRVFVAARVRIFDDSKHLLKTLATTSAEDLAATAFVARPDILNFGLPFGETELPTSTERRTASVRDYENDRLVIDAESGSPGMLVISNNFSPFWEACVNGKKARIIPAYHTFQGILIGPGKSRVELNYNPPYRVIGRKSCGR